MRVRWNAMPVRRIASSVVTDAELGALLSASVTPLTEDPAKALWLMEVSMGSAWRTAGHPHHLRMQHRFAACERRKFGLDGLGHRNPWVLPGYFLHALRFRPPAEGPRLIVRAALQETRTHPSLSRLRSVEHDLVVPPEPLEQ